MNRPAWKTFASAAMCFVVTGVLVAQTPAFTVKLGLWDMVLKIDAGAEAAGAMDLSSLPPEQQAMARGMMASRGMSMGRGGMQMQMKSCMTAEKLSTARVAPERPGQTCTSKVTRSTATVLEYTEACKGTPTTTSEFRVEAVSNTSIKMTGKTSTIMRGSPPQVSTVTMDGTWAADACGDVK